MGNNIEYMSMGDSYSSRFNERAEKLIYQNGNRRGRHMESRVAKLESDVGYIKSDIIDLKSDVKILKSDTSDIKTSMAIMIYKMDGIVESIAKLPTEDKINTKLAEVNAEIVKTNNKIGIESEKIENKINVKFAEMNTELVKTNSKIEIESAKIETKIKDTRLHIILWVLGLPSFLYSVYRGYLLYLMGL